MEKDEYPGNSHRQREGREPRTVREEREPLKSVVSTRPKRRKRPLGKRFVSAFFGTVEGEETTWEHVWFEMILPRVRQLVVDAGIESLEYKVLGGSRRRRGSGRPGYGSRFDRGYDRDRDRDEPRSLSRRARARHDFGEMIFDTKVEAEEVLDSMYDIISKYNTVTVADLLELSGYETTAVDRKWGWDDIRGTGTVRLRSGEYLLDIQPPVEIE